MNTAYEPMKDLYQQHRDMVRILCKKGEELISELTPHKIEVLHMAIGIAGEAGELLDACKKYVVYNQAIDEENIVEELGDLEFYMQGLRYILLLSRERTLCHNLEKLSKRYEGLKYSNEAAKERADKK